ncbi:zinc finger protein ZPR1 [Aphis gossypii]|uniref:zinc finger protein ZPR1 n=1 Tax=Aphis gossypii TaxID=80765 RepID=UPI002158A1BA|nr:zinc finger protein ZPR1 [Aphis gossypii]XP_050061959.1 zinc finger protein ZPR1 [Aphis gossypii]
MANNKSDETNDVFSELDVDRLEVNVIESLCFSCGKNGTTRLLLTRIPYYKELVISSFDCPHCNYKNNQLDPAIEIKPQGVRMSLKIENKEDLDRYVITTDYTSIQVPDLDFEIPPMSQRSQVTTVEGIISKTVTNLSEQKKVLDLTHPELAAKMEVVINGLIGIKNLTKPIPMMVFEDATGNIFVSNPVAPLADPRMQTEMFTRDSAQNEMIGLSAQDNAQDNAQSMIKPLGTFNDSSVNNMNDEIVQFSGPCPNCQAICETNMKVTDIPYFKQVVIMATVCEECGYRTNEVKPGGGIEKQGLQITVKVSSPEDLNRDILKSETCSLRIPQLDFEVGALSLSGRFTTIEGLINSLYEQLKDTATAFYSGDSQSGSVIEKTEKFLAKLNNIKTCKMSVDIILTDPAGNSYVQSLTPPDLDPKLTITRFDRTEEQNEELGLNDIKVDNYEKI